MRRRHILRTLPVPLSALAWPRAGLAQTVRKLMVIGRVHPGSSLDPTLRTYLQAFTDGMRALGHVEGRDYRMEPRFGEGDPARLAAAAADLVRMKVDLIVASGTAGVRAAKQATQSIPIVMAMSGPDPVGTGLIASLARPGGNVTGITGQTDELPAKQLELLREVLPALSDVLILFNPRGSTLPSRSLASIATTLQIRLHEAPIAQAEDLTPAFARATAPSHWAVIALADPAIIDRLRRPIAELAVQHRLASAGSFRAVAAARGLLSYGIDPVDMHRRSAGFVDKILKGAQPAQLPVEQPVKFEMVVNLEAARAIGIAMPPAVLARADEVIE